MMEGAELEPSLAEAVMFSRTNPSGITLWKLSLLRYSVITESINRNKTSIDYFRSLSQKLTEAS